MVLVHTVPKDFLLKSEDLKNTFAFSVISTVFSMTEKDIKREKQTNSGFLMNLVDTPGHYTSPARSLSPSGSQMAPFSS
jgi:translation elongation factor EF-G